MPPRSAKKAPPKQWLYNEDDRRRHADRYWRCPVRLVKDSSRLWARLWRENGTVRGGGAVTSILPVLATHVWPESMKGAEPGWTGWACLSRRRIARLAGLNKDTVSQAFNRLVALGLMQSRREPREKYLGGYRTWYRLSASLYPTDRDDPYAEIPSSLFYGGAWGILPSAAARHLYVVLACLDPIGNETAYLQSIVEDYHGTSPWWDLYYEDPHRYLEYDDSAGRYDSKDLEPQLRIDYLAEHRARHPKSLAELADYSGMKRATVSSALKVLTAPVFGGHQRSDSPRLYPRVALVIRGDASARMPTWYVPDRRAHGWTFAISWLNDPEKFKRLQSDRWPALFRRRGKRARGRVRPAPRRAKTIER